MGNEVRRHDEIQGDIIHEYDGIEEADNELPNWWLATFYGAIVFAAFYWFAYHEYDALPLPFAAYTDALADQAAASGGEVSEEMLVALKNDPTALSEGQATFVTNCAACHLESGAGKIGPNLTDDHWIHGGSPTDMYSIVHDGVLEKGMPAWGPPLGAPAVQKVVAYLLTIRNTNVEGGKEPEGEPWPPGGGAEGDDGAGADEGASEGAADGSPEAPTDGEAAPAADEGDAEQARAGSDDAASDTLAAAH